MRSLSEVIRYSSIRFALYRMIQVSLEKLRNGVFALAWRGALGSVGQGTRIDADVTLVLPRRIRLGRRCYLASRTVLTTESHDSALEIGDRAVIGPDVRIDFTGGVRVGADALISEGVRVYTHDHDTVDFKEVFASPLEIGDHVWLGARAMILSSVKKIGDGAIIGAGSIVTRDVAAGTVVVGNPAREVKKVASKVSNR